MNFVIRASWKLDDWVDKHQRLLTIALIGFMVFLIGAVYAGALHIQDLQNENFQLNMDLRQAETSIEFEAQKAESWLIYVGDIALAGDPHTLTDIISRRFPGHMVELDTNNNSLWIDGTAYPADRLSTCSGPGATGACNVHALSSATLKSIAEQHIGSQPEDNTSG